MGQTVRKSKERSLIIGFIWLLGFIIILFRLLWLQTVHSDELLTKAQEKWMKEQFLRPKRGTIYDRSREQPLAWEVDAYFFAADPSQVNDPKQTAKLLAPILEIEEQTLLKKLSSNAKWVELKEGGKYKYPKSVLNQIEELRNQKKIKGIYAVRTFSRQYHQTEAAHVLGFLDNDDRAVGGVEQFYDQELRGKQGFVSYVKAQNGMMLSDQPDQYRSPKPGMDLVLTIDSRLQHQMELELEEAVKNYGAKGGTAIVADPRTGEILAMASRPVFNPNQYAATINEENAHNRAVESQFEPGSTFKLVTLAAAIEEGVFDPNAMFQSGYIRVGDQVIRDWNGVGWGSITYREGIKKSSNVAFVELGKRLGSQKLIHYIDRFGFGNITNRLGKRTGIDLPAEGRGYFFGRNVYPAELATVSFGQGISVTPIQQVAAICAIANDGEWVKPHVLKEVWEPDLNKRVKTIKPEKKRIIQSETAKQVRQLMRDVVTDGTGVEADIPGYGVAGKTGTAQKPDPEGKGYLKDKYVVSFIGFAPYHDPQLVVYVALDEPNTSFGPVSGGSIAAPIAKDILKKSLQIRKIPPSTEYQNSIK